MVAPFWNDALPAPFPAAASRASSSATSGGQRLLLGARLGGDRLDRLELLAADQIGLVEQAAQTLAQQRLDLALHAGGGADGTAS